MMLSCEVTPDNEPDPHPYWYGRIIEVFHAEIVHSGLESNPVHRRPTKMEFIWMRWLAHDTFHPSGFAARRLHRVAFVPDDSDTPAFGFVNPDEMIRAVHLIPAFALGRTNNLLGASIARHTSEKDEDWVAFDVNM